MRKTIFLLTIIIAAFVTSSYTRKLSTTAPCSGYWFKNNIIAYPSDFSINPAHLIYPTGNNISQVFHAAGTDLPSNFADCTGIPVYVCAVAYDAAYVTWDGYIKPVPTAIPVCEVRYSEFD